MAIGTAGPAGRLSQVAVLVAWVCAGAGANAQTSLATPEQATATGSLKTMVISASRIEQDIEEVPTTVTVLTSEDIDRRNAGDLEDLLKDEVGVSVRAQPHRSSTAFATTGRTGNEGVNIRGLEGEQVRLQVDGVSLPSMFSFGPIKTGRGDFIDPEGYKQVEILRGAASTQYGSDGLAGSVSFVTKEPEDLLTQGKNQQFSLKTSYSSADKSFQVAPSFAFKGEEWQGLVLLSTRRGQETDTMGSNASTGSSRTEANPQSNRSDYLLGKLRQKVSADHAFKLTVESILRETNTDELSERTTVISNDQSRDVVKRNLAKLDWQYTPQNRWFDVLTLGVYAQTSETNQLSWQQRASGTYSYRTRDNYYDDNALGTTLQMESNWGDAVQHRLVYGGDMRFSQQSMLSKAYQNAGTYTALNQYFPDSDYKNLGLFVQDEIKSGRLTVTPGLRYDRYQLSPKPGALNSTTVSYYDLTDGAFSPKLGLSWAYKPTLTLYSQYSHGFKAPTASQVNGGYVSTSPSYTVVGNSNLKSEQSDSVEWGVRGKTAKTQYSAAVFYGKYKDFLYQDTSTTQYQWINLDSVTLYGLELRGAWNVLPAWRVSAAYAHTEGVQDRRGSQTYLNTVDPDKLVLGLHYERGQSWGVSSLITAVERNQHVSSSSTVVPGGYGVLDVTGWYNLSKATKLNAGLYNVLDKKYVQWADVRDLTTASQVDAYSQPGRNFKISVIHQF
ncbi:TonB-dependent hemoglobin/transferrin/lactoferrin family receptor [Curvibacter sp. CHRR-16]|uniref:TonB-dependent hemoglobin/transferrin/lactoferrin family receptor n=1 Tax=Curvibacter sp. CHRR-16 TaxID=2835872 RepID=UPI001BDB6115|nr:TonB-dependent hemoglobin/transferrin/lactoferrin family receptor [Curvibacter sp. CHRR-16]MBT0568864.1 TonB-dependent hemoglobin/transferrin/lactoferrin family receptor [Curvibacter sp. CHRR-16]